MKVTIAEYSDGSFDLFKGTVQLAKTNLKNIKFVELTSEDRVKLQLAATKEEINKILARYLNK